MKMNEKKQKQFTNQQTLGLFVFVCFFILIDTVRYVLKSRGSTQSKRSHRQKTPSPSLSPFLPKRKIRNNMTKKKRKNTTVQLVRAHQKSHPPNKNDTQLPAKNLGTAMKMGANSANIRRDVQLHELLVQIKQLRTYDDRQMSKRRFVQQHSMERHNMLTQCAS